MGGGAFKRPPPAGGGKSRGPAGRGLMASPSPLSPPSALWQCLRPLYPALSPVVASQSPLSRLQPCGSVSVQSVPALSPLVAPPSSVPPSALPRWSVPGGVLDQHGGRAVGTVTLSVAVSSQSAFTTGDRRPANRSLMSYVGLAEPAAPSRRQDPLSRPHFPRGRLGRRDARQIRHTGMEPSGDLHLYSATHYNTSSVRSINRCLQ